MKMPLKGYQAPRRFTDERGALVCLEAGVHIPFDVRSVVYTCDVPFVARRGGHAHHELHQFIKCASGSVTVTTISQNGTTETVLTQDSDGVYIPPMTWSEQYNHTPGTVVLVMSSEHYDESDYIRDIGRFTALLDAAEPNEGTNDQTS